MTDASGCEIYSYGSQERALEAFSHLVAQAKTREDLSEVFKILKRSGLDPNDPELNLNGNPQIVLSWADVDTIFSGTITAYNAGDKSFLKKVSRKHGLRDKVLEISENETGGREKRVEEMLAGMKEWDMIQVGDVKFLKLENGEFRESIDIHGSGAIRLPSPTSPEEVKKIALAADPKSIRVETYTAREKARKEKKEKEMLPILEQFRNMKVGDIVKIRWSKYVKARPDLFRTYAGGNDDGHTVVVGFHTPEQIEAEISNASPDEIKFENEIVKKQSVELAQDKVDLEQLKLILPELYPDIPREWFDPGKPDSFFNDVVKYLPKSEIQQGKVGDCYLLAAINGLKKGHPRFYLSVLSKSLRKGHVPGTWQVRFPGADNDSGKEDILDPLGWITLTKNEISQWSKLGMKGDLPDIILERGYASYVSRKEFGDAGHSTEYKRDGKLPVEGGLGHRALHDLIGAGAAMKNKIGWGTDLSLKEGGQAYSARAFLLGEFKDHPEKYVVTINTPPMILVPKDRMVRGYKMHSQHAFSVLGVIGENVYINNPHDTRTQIVLSIDDVLTTFNQISYVELK